jgi:hypothetical protein
LLEWRKVRRESWTVIGTRRTSRTRGKRKES